MCIRDRMRTKNKTNLTEKKPWHILKIAKEVSISKQTQRNPRAVSYTHLDVYKRQTPGSRELLGVFPYRRKNARLAV